MQQYQKIYELKCLISEWEDASEELDIVIDAWNSVGDPTCDPGLQFEQEEKINRLYNQIVEFAKSMQAIK